VRVTLLGPVAAAAAGTALPLGGLKQRAVFALMALNAGRVVALDRLVDELWTDEPPSRATLSLQSYVARLRRVLADVSASDGETPRILTQPPGWLLTLDPGLVDVTRFEALIADARSAFLAGDPAAASRALQEALALYTGEPMADLTDVRFAREEADRLNELRLSATELLLQTQLALGESDAVAERAGRFVAANPFRERGWSAYMIALYRSGRQSEALGAAARLRRLLATELGVDPSAEVRRLEERILRQDPALLTPEVVRAAGPAATGSASSSPSSSGPSSSGPSSSGPSPSGPESSSPTRLVGRDGVLSAVDTVVAAAGAGRGRLVLLHAPAGLGKSSILAELETRVRDAGGTVLRGDCIGADAAPALWPWVSVVRGLAAGDADSARRALAGLQHGRIGPDGGDPTDPPVSRMQLFRAVIDALAAERALRPVAVVMDDVHWADADTTTLLSLAVDELAAHGVLFAVAVRSGEAGADRVLALVDRLRRADVHRVSLLPLGVREVGVLVGELSGADPPGEVISAIHDRTAGNPLFVRELVRLLASEQRLDAEGVSATLPGEVREVLRHRIARLPQQTVAVLTVIAVAGSPATVDLLAAVTGLDHDAVLDGCEAAELAGLLIDDSRHPGCFVLSHDLMRQTLEQSLSGARRLRLHARIAEALQTRRPMNAQEIVDVARHLTVAAPLVGPAAAVPYLIAASDDALSRYANDQAERHLRTALELIPQVRDPAERSALTGPVRARLSFLLLTVHGSGIKIEAGAGRDIARPTDPESTVGWLGAMFEAVTNGRAPMAAAAAEVVLAGDMLPMTRFCAHFVRGFASELTGRIALAGQDFEATEQLVADGVDVQVAGFFAGAVASAAQLALVSHMSGDEARADTMLATASGRAAGSERALAIVALHQTWLGAMRGDALTTRQHAAECRALATRLDFGMYGHAADLIGGWADAVAGDAGGAARADSAFDRYVAGEARMLVPMYLLLRAEAHAVSGATTLVHELIRQSRAVEAQVGEVCSSPRLLAWAASTLPVEA
jgi:DNA-binding SARP family transcriptional activator